MNSPATEDNPYATPEALLADVLRADGPVHASRGIRLAATLLDGLFLGVALGLGFALIGVFQTPEAGQWAMVVVLLAVVGLLVVNAVLLARNGQTLAKYLLKIRVARPDGSNPGLARIFFARYLPVAVLSILPFVGPVVSLVDALMIFRDNHRCLHDEIADTVVVKV
jgi:uncharacterized RDD family membrane protein YckC